jgi:hypothetical protein
LLMSQLFTLWSSQSAARAACAHDLPGYYQQVNHYWLSKSPYRQSKPTKDTLCYSFWTELV